MAQGDIGMFLPAESHYSKPGTYDAMLTAEAAKQANYLAQMDQFFAQLEESQRQFDEMLDFQTETRDLELEWDKEKTGMYLDLQKEAIAAQKQAANAQGHITLGGGVSEKEQWEFLKGYFGGQRSAGSTPQARFTPWVYGPNQSLTPPEEGSANINPAASSKASSDLTGLLTQETEPVTGGFFDYKDATTKRVRY